MGDCEDILVDLIRGNRTLRKIDLSRVYPPVWHTEEFMKALEDNSTLSHLRLGLIDLTTGPQAITSLIQVNTTLAVLHIGEDEYPTEGLDQIELILKLQNTSLTDLSTRYGAFDRRCRPYLRRNLFLKLTKTLGKPAPAILGAAIGRIAATNNIVSSATAVYTLLRDNIGAIVSSINTTKRSLAHLKVETEIEYNDFKVPRSSP